MPKPKHGLCRRRWLGRSVAMIIDAHVHLYPREVDADPAAWAERVGERHWATLCTRKRRDGRPVQSLPTVDELLRTMDEAGIARAILLGWYWEKPDTCVWQNRFFAACVRAHPDRLSGCATLHAHAGVEATVAELRRAHDDGLIGVGELSPHSQGYECDDPAFVAALHVAGELQLPVNLHVTDPASRPYVGRIETPFADFARLAREFPATTFILAHWGGGVARQEAWGEMKTLPNVYFDTAASPLLYGADIWAEMQPRLGGDRVLFGSDFPLNLYPKLDAQPSLVRFVAEAKAGGADAAVLGQTARRVFRL